LIAWLRGKRAATPPAEIRRSFEEAAADEEHFPPAIDPRILHVREVLAATAGSRRVLDLGCGKGRFAIHVKNANPAASVVAFDLAEAMLRAAPAALDRCAGSMLELPFRDASFDSAYATESLEHAVNAERAVAELCRVVRPGGRLLIIDKNAAHWGRLPTPPWERWFRAEELERLLLCHCREASCAPISYWADVPPDGLFLCWKAVR
jgi:ubiquinone/menaquinone biosynthesis C-methylase UbiE